MADGVKRRGIRTTRGIRALLALGVFLLGCPGDDLRQEGSPSASDRAAAPRTRRTLCCLGSGDVASGVLAPGERASYGVPLATGERLEVLLRQEHSDLALRLLDPGGTRLLRLDTPVGRQAPEHLLYVAAEPGTYTLEVEAVPASRAARFQLEVVAVAPADREARRRASAVVHLAQGHELRRQGVSNEAVQEYRAAAESWAAVEDPARQADALRWAARLLERSGRPAEASRALERAAAAFARAGLVERQARTLTDLGETLREAGRPDSALDAFTRALELQRRHDQAAAQARTLTLLANLHKVRHQPAAAARRYEEALALWRQLERPRDAAITLANLAGVYSVAGQPKTALDLLDEARKLLPADAAAQDRAFVLEEMGLAHRRLHRGDRAREAYRTALEHRRRAGTPEDTVHALEGLGRLHYESGEYQEALELYREALARLDEADDPLRTALLVQNMGWVQLRRGEPRRALTLLRRALPTFQQRGSTVAEASTLAGIARVERALGHLQPAAAWAERALNVLEEARAATDRVDLRASLLASRHTSFDVAVDCLMKLHRREPEAGYDRRAFSVSERGRARRLLDVLGSPAPPHDRPTASSEAPAEIAALRERVNDAEEERLRLLEEEADSDLLERAERRLRSALEELRSALEELRSARSGRATARRAEGVGLQLAPTPLTSEEVQESVLAPGHLLLSYDLGEERSYVWAITVERVESFTLPAGAELEDAARRAYDLLSQSHRRGSSLQVDLQVARLAKLVLGPVAELVAGASTIVVAAEGDLQLIPFGVLDDPAGEGPLLAHREVVATPSVSALARLRDLREVESASSEPARLLAVVADPVFGPEDERLASDEATPSPTPPPAGESTSRLGRLPFRRLPFSELEAQAVLARAPVSAGVSFQGFEATKDRLLGGALQGYRILHFATHGLASAEHPELSALVLSRLGPQGGLRDGFLWAHEIAGLELSAELVVLSACETGLGVPFRGEGLVGLPHAFFQAGVPRVVVSLWPVDDRAAVELMGRFYDGYLGQGLDAGEALRRARLSLLRETRWSRPYYWAGFTLQTVG